MDLNIIIQKPLNTVKSFIQLKSCLFFISEILCFDLTH